MKMILLASLLVVAATGRAQSYENGYGAMTVLLSMDQGWFFTKARTPEGIVKDANLILEQAYRCAEVTRRNEFTDAERAELRAAEAKYTKILAEKQFALGPGFPRDPAYLDAVRRAYTVYNVVLLEENMRRAHGGLPPLPFVPEDQKSNSRPGKTKKGGVQ